MTWPFVSRARYDDAVAQHAADRVYWRDLWMAERERSDRLLDQLTTMQKAGFQVAPPVQEPAAPVLPQQVTAAISEHMELTGSAGRQTALWAEAKIKEGWPIERVILYINNGADFDHEAA